MYRDLRKYARETNVRLAIGAVLLIFVVGEGLIYLIYGAEAAQFGLLCLCAMSAPAVMIVASLLFMEKLVERARRK